ncbi:hypothetical protein QIU18_06655 [Capnocytophaga canimorsus]|nr:hypothetical protein [Capnocytophaga canimorsus]WGU71459.1 hypothetical protein QIU18_06655 [Capnocytophaga canimorsus]
MASDYQLSPDGTTLLSWDNKAVDMLDMTSIAELSQVTRIADKAFQDCSDLTELTLPPRADPYRLQCVSELF